ncbi:hypothetical protein [Thermofilum sp.]|jgi:hypothetical protein|uniref:hypothetical protein n=1 Tax=Thermofilum sp. TaxID=1961369 RepID=UPI002590FFAA|nr:hypothetical protein [Thermofilum sp.]
MVHVLPVEARLKRSLAPIDATEGDARSNGAALSSYGLSAALYDVVAKVGSPVSASGFSFSVSGLYIRNSTDVRNNVA